MHSEKKTRRLATANISLVNICVTNFFARIRDVIEPVKIVLSSNLINKENVNVICHTVWAHVKNGDAGALKGWGRG